MIDVNQVKFQYKNHSGNLLRYLLKEPYGKGTQI